MIINWYGEGCFKIQSGGLTLLTDVYDSKIGLTPPRGKFDIELKTLVPWPLVHEKDVPEGARIIYGAGEYEIKEVVIHGVPILKESSEKFLKTAYRVDLEDLKIGFFGHISEELSPESLEIFSDIDIVFLPTSGKPFIDEEKAVKLIKQIGPKIIVASFYKTPGLKRSAGDWKKFADELGQKPEVLEKLTIKKKEIAEQKGMKLVVLKI